MKFPKGPMVRVNCTKELITKAVSADSSKCWIAEAIKGSVPHAKNVAVDLATVRFSDLERGLRYVYLTPYTAQRALLDFDEGKPPAPFSFQLRNAHVTRAGTSEARKQKRNHDRAAKKRAAGADVHTKTRDHVAADNRARVIATNTGTHSSGAFRRYGGRRPPQLRTLRQFGIRAFRGASKARLDADIAAVQRAEDQG